MTALLESLIAEQRRCAAGDDPCHPSRRCKRCIRLARWRADKGAK